MQHKECTPLVSLFRCQPTTANQWVNLNIVMLLFCMIKGINCQLYASIVSKCAYLCLSVLYMFNKFRFCLLWKVSIVLFSYSFPRVVKLLSISNQHYLALNFIYTVLQIYTSLFRPRTERFDLPVQEFYTSMHNKYQVLRSEWKMKTLLASNKARQIYVLWYSMSCLVVVFRACFML